jgi:hypothetical protein
MWRCFFTKHRFNFLKRRFSVTKWRFVTLKRHFRKMRQSLVLTKMTVYFAVSKKRGIFATQNIMIKIEII